MASRLLYVAVLLLTSLASLARGTAPPQGCPKATIQQNTKCVVNLFEFFVGLKFSLNSASCNWDKDTGLLWIDNFPAGATIEFQIYIELDIFVYECVVYCGGSGSGDPHFRGFDGSSFDFNGIAGNSYELLTDEDTLVNIQMVKRGLFTSEDGSRVLLPQFNGRATWIGALGLEHAGVRVTVAKDEDESALVRINNDDLSLGFQAISPLLNVTFLETPFSAGLWGPSSRFTGIPTAIITTKGLTVKVDMPPNHARRMDISLARHQDSLPEAEGIIGRTVASSITGETLDADVTDAVVMEEGDSIVVHSTILEEKLTAAYLTSGLFANDAAKTIYNPAANSDTAAEYNPVISAVSSITDQIFEPATVSHRRLLY